MKTKRGVPALLALLGCLALSACEAMGGKKGESLSGITAIGKTPEVPGQTTVAPPEGVPLPSPAVMASRRTGGAVTVYDLDQSPKVSRAEGVLPPVALQSAADPSVDVYPLRYDPGAGSGARWAGSDLLIPSGSDAMAGKVLEGPDFSLGAAAGSPARIFFEHGSSRITPAARKVLEELAAWSKRTGGAVVVEGHASRRAGGGDLVGRETTNLKQSLDRAYAVSRELLRLGVAADRVVTSGFGDARPALPVPGRDTEAASRRVEIYTEDKLPGAIR